MIYGKTIGRIILDGLTEVTKVASSKDRLSEAASISDGLEKIASLDLGANNEPSLKEMIKMASVCIRGLVEEVSGMQKAAQVEEIVQTMIDRGVVGPMSFESKVAELLKKDDHELSIIKEATKLATTYSLFEKQASSSATPQKRGMFDGVI